MNGDPHHCTPCLSTAYSLHWSRPYTPDRRRPAMKLITAIAALALVAGSVDVEAQKRGDASNKPGGAKRPV